MNEKVLHIKEKLNLEIKTIDNLKQLNELKVKYLGKKGSISELSNMIGTLSIEEKRVVGKLINELKEYANSLFDNLTNELNLRELNEKLEKETIDITLPGTKINTGNMHPLTRITREIEELFVSMGYDIVEGPEVETDFYCFEQLNVPKNHPARDSQDSFYINEELLLRTQTSAVQARTMEINEEKTPIRILCPGKTYRRDNDDATHSHQFMQIEGLVIDKNISLSDLKGTLEIFAKRLFSNDTSVRFRPSFFPFTEPSLEVDISCFKCKGKGCSFCKNTGWIEILGAGVVHPNVLKKSGYNPDQYTGFAFGIGIERVAMLKYGINDIRNFYVNDMRFLDNFKRIDGGESNESK